MVKIYQSINALHLITEVDIEGVRGVIEFKGGSRTPKRVNGTFATDNPKLQRAIESDICYGKEFILIKKTDTRPKSVPAKTNKTKNNE